MRLQVNGETFIYLSFKVIVSSWLISSVFVMRILWYFVLLGHYCWLSIASVHRNIKELAIFLPSLPCPGPVRAHLLLSHPPTPRVIDSGGLFSMGKTTWNFEFAFSLVSSARMIIQNILVKTSLLPQWFFCSRNPFVVKRTFKLM